MAKKKIKNRSLLFEIGVEELPAGMIEIGRAELLRAGARILAEEGRFDCKGMAAWGTPRRLVLSVDRLEALPAAEDEVLGPKEGAAYDESGKPTKALAGFLKSRGASEADVYIKESSKGRRVALRVSRTQKPLAACLEQLIAELSFPKMMRWIGEKGVGVTFPRPVRWILALDGTRVIRFKAGAVKSGRFTYGHRFLSPKRISIPRADLAAFKKRLKKKRVWLDEAERIAYVEKSLVRLKSRNHDRDLVETVARLVEEPFAVEGAFRKEYLALPPDVLATCMAKNQKIFACFRVNGKAECRFVAFLNGRRADVKAIVREYERVLEARLSDAALFYREDQKTPLSARAEQLKQLAFLGKLGTIFDKQERVARLASHLVKDTEYAGLAGSLQAAARLAKADLVTQMVYEFPELQGIMGADYARKDGVEPETAAAIRDHYWPKSLRDTLERKKPLGVRGAWLGIADRLDTLAGAFGSGIQLSGSQDPYALRRAAGGIVKIVTEMNRLGTGRIEFSLDGGIRAAYAGYAGLKLSEDDVTEKLMQVFTERMTAEWWTDRDPRSRELLEGVLKASSARILGALEKFEHLKALYGRERNVFSRACKVVERTHNILKGSPQPVGDRVEDALLADGVERSLFDALGDTEPRVLAYVRAHKYADATRAYANDFYDIIHRYFDEVLVNAEDEAVRKNRHALMQKVNRLYTAHVADLSCVTQLSE